MLDFLQQYRVCLAGLSGSITFDRCPLAFLSMVSMGDNPMNGEIEAFWSADGNKLEALVVQSVYQRRIHVDEMNL